MKNKLLLLPVLLAGLLASCGSNQDPGKDDPGKDDPAVVHVESISLNKKTLSLEEGGSQTLTYTINPNNADDKSVTWESSNGTVASVENGVVKAWNAGTADISVTALDGNKKDTCRVTVTKPAPKTITDTYVADEQGYTKTEIALLDNPIVYGDYTMSFKLDVDPYNNSPKIIKNTKNHYEIRAYWGNSFTINSSKNSLVKIEFTTTENDKGNTTTASVGSLNGNVWTGNAKEVTFSVAGSSGYRAFSQVAFTYEGEPEDPEAVINLGNKSIAEVKQYIADHPVKKNAFGNGVNEKRYVTISGYVLACIETVKTTSKFGLDVTFPSKVILGDETGVIGVATGNGQGTIWDKAKDYRCQQTTKYSVTGYLSEILGKPELKIISYNWDQTLDIDWSIDVWKEDTITLEKFYENACNTNYNCGGSGYGGVYEIKGLYCYNAESSNQHLKFYNLTDGTLNLRINAYNMPTLSMGSVYDITGIISLKDYSPIIVPFEIKQNTTAGTTFDYKNVAVTLTATELNNIHGPQDDTSTKQPNAIMAYSKIYCIDTTGDKEAEKLTVDNYKLFYEYGYNYPPVVYFALKQFDFTGGGKGAWQITLVPDCVYEYNK